MRFGHFFYPMNFDPARDYQVITDCLAEAALVEQLGLDAIWMAEHHCTGETVYGDALVFAAAVAMKTQRILLGLGVVEMALHHPVQLAIQTALLDNLSRGRLIVGTGRGSNYNAYEYRGFGTDILEGQQRLPEAEDLLVKAWTTEALETTARTGRSPSPQCAHDPISSRIPPGAGLFERGVDTGDGTPGATRAAARTRGDAGGGVHPALRENHARGGLRGSAGRAGPRPVMTMVRGPMSRRQMTRRSKKFCRRFSTPAGKSRPCGNSWNPKDLTLPHPPPPLPREAYGPTPNAETNEALVGSPQQMAAHIALLQDSGVRNLMLTNRGLLSREQTQAALRLLSAQVKQQFRGDSRLSAPADLTCANKEAAYAEGVAELWIGCWSCFRCALYPSTGYVEVSC